MSGGWNSTGMTDGKRGNIGFDGAESGIVTDFGLGLLSKCVGLVTFAGCGWSNTCSRYMSVAWYYAWQDHIDQDGFNPADSGKETRGRDNEAVHGHPGGIGHDLRYAGELKRR